MSSRLGEPVTNWKTRPDSVRAKRIYDPVDTGDGLRLLVTQYWPRGVARTAVDEYVRVLGPSRSLLQAFRSGEIAWREYKTRYLAEMRGEAQQAEIHRLAKLSREQNVTVMCVCPDESHCHRSLLRELIARFND